MMTIQEILNKAKKGEARWSDLLSHESEVFQKVYRSFSAGLDKRYGKERIYHYKHHSGANNKTFQDKLQGFSAVYILEVLEHYGYYLGGKDNINKDIPTRKLFESLLDDLAREIEEEMKDTDESIAQSLRKPVNREAVKSVIEFLLKGDD